jgi:tetratricopeptide (TPR) repeat protein
MKLARRHGLLFGFFAAAIALTASPGGAQTQQQSDWCESHDYSLDLRIEGCTAVIQSGGLPGKALSSIYFTRGRAYQRKGQYDSAIADFTQFIQLGQLGPEAENVFYSRGLTYYAKGDYDRAIADYSGYPAGPNG